MAATTCEATGATGNGYASNVNRWTFGDSAISNSHACECNSSISSARSDSKKRLRDTTYVSVGQMQRRLLWSLHFSTVLQQAD